MKGRTWPFMSVDVTYLDHLDRGREYYLQTGESILHGLDRDRRFLTPSDAYWYTWYWMNIYITLTVEEIWGAAPVIWGFPSQAWAVAFHLGFSLPFGALCRGPYGAGVAPAQPRYGRDWLEASPKGCRSRLTPRRTFWATCSRVGVAPSLMGRSGVTGHRDMNSEWFLSLKGNISMASFY